MEQEKTSVSHIVTHKMGVATEMVEAALHPSPTSLQTSVDSERQRDPLWRYSKFMKRYSECLLASGENCSKSRVHKPRARRAREGLKNGEARDELLNWVGPAPWDVMIGGDGKPKFLCDVMVCVLDSSLFSGYILLIFLQYESETFRNDVSSIILSKTF